MELEFISIYFEFHFQFQIGSREKKKRKRKKGASNFITNIIVIRKKIIFKQKPKPQTKRSAVPIIR